MTAGGRREAPVAAEASQRLDRWLWFARAVKSRTLAAALIESGKIRVNAVKVLKPSFAVKAGDVVVSSASKEMRILEVKAPGQRRGPAAEAELLYQDLTPKPTPKEKLQGAPVANQAADSGRRNAGSGRPTKRERRDLERLQGRN